MTMTVITRTDYDIPDMSPQDECRAGVKLWRRECADWLRAHGMMAHGAVWDAVMFGDRDLTSLRSIARETGGLAKHWSGYVMPTALADGDMTDWGTVIGAPVTDPDTGTVWFAARGRNAGRTISDVELAPDIPVRARRGKGTRS